MPPYKCFSLKKIVPTLFCHWDVSKILLSSLLFRIRNDTTWHPNVKAQRLRIPSTEAGNVTRYIRCVSVSGAPLAFQKRWLYPIYRWYLLLVDWQFGESPSICEIRFRQTKKVQLSSYHWIISIDYEVVQSTCDKDYTLGSIHLIFAIPANVLYRTVTFVCFLWCWKLVYL